MFSKSHLRYSVFLFVLSLFLSLSVNAVQAEVKVKFWHAMSGKRIELLKGMAEDFNKTHPGITVEAQYIGSYNETLNKTISAVKAGTAPHIFQLYEVGTRGMIDAGMIMPIGDLAKPGEVDWGDYVDAVMSYYKVDGKLYSMPFNSSTPILFYNKTLFKKAGLDPAMPPETWSQVRKLGKKIMDSGAAEAGITWNLHSWYFEQWHAVQNTVLANHGNGREGRADKVLFDGAPGVNIVKWWTGLEKDKIYLNAGRGWSNHRKAFISGQAAMMISSTSDVTQMTEAFNTKGWELGTGFFPRPDDVPRQGVAIGGGTLWMTKDHPKEEIAAAWEFLKWMSMPEQQVTWHKGTGYFPIRKSAMKLLEEEGWYTKFPNYKVAFDQLLQTKTSLATQGALIGVFPQLRDAVQSAIEKVYEGKATPESALKEAAQKTNKELENYNSLYK
ncbi:MAG: ABC transporter substrate-binding protein [Desulfobacterales bacterium]|nr:ABC transporter substrate-binding protein [Deltaproteobacteria bacterium]NNL77386.1 ABC transporter substrate-binding protein [Desulfobacterales bacterium]